MTDLRYKGLRIIHSLSAARELAKLGENSVFVLKVLDEGYNAPRKRKKGTIEKWLDKGKKTFNVVIVKDYEETYHEEVWVIIHFGKFTKKKKRRFKW
ncbi:MAG: hypothetical protein KKG60_03940 [Nanoarchaeota archaeon]|nr:hypothetical protein [Nanoarchaeota archaeon]